MSIQQTIVEKFVRKQDQNWPRDMKVATRLMKIFPENGFWDWVEPYPLVSNLAFLQNQEILDTLKERYSLFLQQKDLKQSKEKLKESFDLKALKVYNEGSDKVGEDVQIVKKPKTLKEFLNYGKTSETAS